MPAIPVGEAGAALGPLTEGLGDMGDVVAEAAQDIVPLIIVDLQTKFAAGQDPYGSAWAERMKSYSWPILDRTGRLKGSLLVQAQGENISVEYNNDIASYHQDGTKRLPQRKLAPDGDMPPEWVQWYEEALMKRVAEKIEQALLELA
jgi:phage gpG-like protein